VIQTRKAHSFGGLIVVTLLVGLLLAACGDSTPAPLSTTTTVTKPTNTAVAAPNPVTISWSFWGDDDEIKINTKIKDQFEKFNPGIKVQMLHEKWENYFNRVESDWSGSKAPDVLFLSYIPQYASEGILENIDPLISADKNIKIEDIYSGLLDTFRYNKGLYGLPRDNDTKVIYVNKKLFEAAGVPLPKAGWTWQELLDISRKLTKRDAAGNISQYAYAFELNEWWKLWVWQNGGEVFDNFNPPEPPTKLLVNTPDAAAGVQFFADLINKEKVTPSVDVMYDSDKATELFTSGKLAMLFGNHAKVPALSAVSGLSWDVLPLPAGKKRVNVLGGAGYSISKNSQHKNEAWQFVKFLTGDDGQAFFAETGVVVPARSSVREDNIFVRNIKFNTQVFVDETKVGKQILFFRNSTKVSRTMDSALEAVWRGQKTAAEVFATLPDKVEPIFAESKR